MIEHLFHHYCLAVVWNVVTSPCVVIQGQEQGAVSVCATKKVNNDDRLCVVKVIKTLMNVLKFNMRYINLDV